MTISPYTRHVLIVLYELNIPFENVVVSLATGDQKSPEHIARQPFGKIPVLEDDGFLIFESRAICKYLVKKYGKGTKLIPGDEDLKAYAMYEQVSIFTPMLCILMLIVFRVAAWKFPISTAQRLYLP